MPKVEIPLPSYTDFPKLKKIRNMIAERVKLYRRGKEAETRLKGVDDEPGLNYQLYTYIVGVLPKDVKSFEFADDDGEKFRVSLMASEKGRRALSESELLSTPFKVKCRHCGKNTETTLPTVVLEGAKKEGKVPDPTISVTPIEEGK